MKSKAKELRTKNLPELQQELLELLKAQFGLRMQHATQQLGNTAQLRNVRRDIARTKTILAQKAKQS
jgi:large subunit ribosomal protein L29